MRARDCLEVQDRWLKLRWERVQAGRLEVLEFQASQNLPFLISAFIFIVNQFDVDKFE